MKIFSIIREVGIVKFGVAVLGEVYRKIVREKIIGSYAQDYEDVQIEKILKESRGYYVDIGAYHPTRLSNTYRFYRKGWRGVVVEPNPETEEMFHKIRPKDIYIAAGIGLENTTIDYYRYLIPALNTFSPVQVKENKKSNYSAEKVVKIKVWGIKEFLKKFVKQKIDLLSLDVEGWDEKILKNWYWRYKPRIICVENLKDWKLLKKLGYKLYFKTKHNLIFSLKN